MYENCFLSVSVHLFQEEEGEAEDSGEDEVVVVGEGVGEDLEGEEVFAEVEEVGEEEEEDSIDSSDMKDFETCSFRSDIDDLSGKIKMPEPEGEIMDNTRTEEIVYINIVVPAASVLIDYHYHQVIIHIINLSALQLFFTFL